MRDLKLLAALAVVIAFCVACADLSHDISSKAQSLDQVIKIAHTTISGDLNAISVALLTGRTVDAQKAVKKAQKDVESAFSRVQKYDDSLDKTAIEAAKQADAAEKVKPTFFQKINPFYYFGKAWSDFKDGVKVSAAWIGILALVTLILEYASAFSPIIAAILKFIGMVLGHVIKIFTNIADGIFTVLEQTRVSPPKI